MSGEEVKASSRSELMELPLVRNALDQAEVQVAAYRSALENSRGDSVKLRTYVVVALGFERLVVPAT